MFDFPEVMVSKESEAKGRVIVTFGRSYQTLSAVQSLGRQGVESIVCDEAPMMMAFYCATL